ncbi:MAG: glyceraldehyde 3-phosphate dehydrogenase NAD-binding domain-containing protein, partial [Gammaproteobacteria bacterium]
MRVGRVAEIVRTSLRKELAILERNDDDFELVSINDLADAKANALLFAYDSTHGRFRGEVVLRDGA